MSEIATADRLWTHQEAAEFLHIPVSTLYALNASGRGPRSYKIGRLRRYHPTDVRSWLDQQGTVKAAS